MSPKAKDFPDEGPKRRVMVGAIGACVHNLGVEGFADWMEDKEIGYISVKLGPAVPIPEVINKIREARPEVVGISMRLGDLHVDKLIGEFTLESHCPNQQDLYDNNSRLHRRLQQARTS